MAGSVAVDATADWPGEAEKSDWVEGRRLYRLNMFGTALMKLKEQVLSPS